MKRAVPSVLLAALGVLLVLPGQAQQTPARILTDTPEYCLDLARRVAGWTDPPDSARTLSDQGRTLCAHGQVLAGIARLRRALVVLEHGDRGNAQP